MFGCTLFMGKLGKSYKDTISVFVDVVLKEKFEGQRWELHIKHNSAEQKVLFGHIAVIVQDRR